VLTRDKNYSHTVMQGHREFPGIAHPQIPGGNSREFRGKLIFPRNFVQNAA